MDEVELKEVYQVCIIKPIKVRMSIVDWLKRSSLGSEIEFKGTHYIWVQEAEVEGK